MGSTPLTHVYGLALFTAFAMAWSIAERPFHREASLWAALAASLAAVWLAMESRAPPLGGSDWPPLSERVARLPSEVLGGYADGSEALLLALSVALFALLSHRDVPVTGARWRRLGRTDRALHLLFAANVVLYFVLPRATPTAKSVHFRHAVVAACLLPVVAGRHGLMGRTFFRRAMLAVLGVLAATALFNTWNHLRLFDREARSFEPVLAAVPARSRLVYLAADPNGRVMRTMPYLHFGAYAQAAHGGLMTMGFPEVFWNIPVALRSDVGIPATPLRFEWLPELLDERSFGFYYDHVLVRSAERRVAKPSPAFPFRLVKESLPWQLYRRVE